MVHDDKCATHSFVTYLPVAVVSPAAAAADTHYLVWHMLLLSPAPPTALVQHTEHFLWLLRHSIAVAGVWPAQQLVAIQPIDTVQMQLMIHHQHYWLPMPSEHKQLQTLSLSYKQ